jgi:hypothetical protein
MRQDTCCRTLDPKEHEVAALFNICECHIVVIEDMAETDTFDAYVALTDCKRMRMILAELRNLYGVQPQPKANVAASFREENRVVDRTYTWLDEKPTLFEVDR